jgi:putative addiction module component (TIGR02574 family)
MMRIQVDEILSLSIKDRLRLVGEIWDSIAASPVEIPLTASQRKELDRRKREHRRNPSDGKPWSEIKARLEMRLGRSLGPLREDSSESTQAKPRMIRAVKLILILAAATSTAFGCAGPSDGHLFHGVFPGDAAGVKVATRVIYRGVDIGSVETVSLIQKDPTTAAVVKVGFRVTNEDVVLRKNDRLLINREGLLGDSTIEVIPASGTSEPLQVGATIEGEVARRVDFERLIESISAGSERKQR